MDCFIVVSLEGAVDGPIIMQFDPNKNGLGKVRSKFDILFCEDPYHCTAEVVDVDNLSSCLARMSVCPHAYGRVRKVFKFAFLV